ncbi:MAG TPA: alpha-glucan family phosphorylase, partial [Epsilonproteobacteria bacterium]|nr:alpha-glucan family phosphorylase [Campylobacterota bacterium]
ELKKHVVFTTHTPEDAGNEEHDISKLFKFGFFNGLDLETVREMSLLYSDRFNLTLGALRSVKRTNAVSKFHGEVANRMWKEYEGVSEITYITNAQNRRYWMDKGMQSALDNNEDYVLVSRKKHLKRQLFDEVADQTGKMFNPDILTLVWARRFAEYKRPGLIKRDFARFKKMLENEQRPVQIIWAGKPYPFDSNAVNTFNELIHISREIDNMAVLTGYELKLSRTLKYGADVWINTPRVSREASGTSGMTAAMNGAIHFSTNDGWHPEYAKNGYNSFTIPDIDHSQDVEDQDTQDNKNMMDILENEIIPIYYDKPSLWTQIMKSAMKDVIPAFDSGRMAHEYYTVMYNEEK